jgi:hypothetical protein
MIKAIDTFYNGNYFRSRLEARWAVFFDELNLKYDYEPQGYVVNGVPYLPDFYLPKFNCFCECKPGITDWNHEEVESGIDKAIDLSLLLKKDLMLLIDKPSATNIRYFNYDLVTRLGNQKPPHDELIRSIRLYTLYDTNAIVFEDDCATKNAMRNAIKKRFEHQP